MTCTTSVGIRNSNMQISLSYIIVADTTQTF